MRPDPRADYIVRWRYAIVAESLRASARDAEGMMSDCSREWKPKR